MSAAGAAASPAPRDMSAAPAAAPPRPANTAPASATLVLCPTTRPVARKPAALPRSRGGADPISALLFGAWKSAWPKPITRSLHTISHTVLSARSVPRRISPTQAMSRPTEARKRVLPVLSATRPLIGATTAMVRGSGVRSSPAVMVGNPRSCSR